MLHIIHVITSIFIKSQKKYIIEVLIHVNVFVLLRTVHFSLYLEILKWFTFAVVHSSFFTKNFVYIFFKWSFLFLQIRKIKWK